MTAVALRKESVDRNLYYGDDLTFSDGSLSARRAWIEIWEVLNLDRWLAGSLSARRAWIEIVAPSSAPYAELSLSARRAWIEIGTTGLPVFLASPGRSPQGERG